MSFFLDTKTQSLIARLQQSPVSSQPTFEVSFVEYGLKAFSKKEQGLVKINKSAGELSGASDAVLVAPPDGGTQFAFDIIGLSVRNVDTAPVLLTIVSLDTSSSPSEHIEWRGTLNENESLIFTNDASWKVLDDSGIEKTALSGTGGGGGTDIQVREDGTVVEPALEDIDFRDGLVATFTGTGFVRVDVDFLAASAENGSATTAARSDHLHDLRYYTETELSSLLVNQGASLIGINDAGGYYTSTHVEAALQEIAAEIDQIQADLANHDALDTLVHNIAEDSYVEYLYSSGKVVSETHWDSPAKLIKIREFLYTYTGSKVDTETVNQYNSVGGLVQTLLRTYAYSGSQVSNITESFT